MIKIFLKDKNSKKIKILLKIFFLQARLNTFKLGNS